MAREYSHREIADLPITHEGVTRSLQSWAEVLGVPYVTARMRYKRGHRNFHDLFRKDYSRATTVTVREEADKVVVTHQARTVLDDLFHPDTVARVREIAKQANMAPIQVVQKIVDKKTAELLSDQQTN